jgi:hypothetical protein
MADNRPNAPPLTVVTGMWTEFGEPGNTTSSAVVEFLPSRSVVFSGWAAWKHLHFAHARPTLGQFKPSHFFAASFLEVAAARLLAVSFVAAAMDAFFVWAQRI